MVNTTVETSETTWKIYKKLNNVKNIFTPLIATLFFVAITIGVLITSPSTDTFYSAGTIKELIPPTGWSSIGAIITNFVAITLTAVFITNLSLRYELVKEHTLLPTLFFLLFQSLDPSLINNFAGQNATFILAWIATYILYESYQQDNSSEKGFLITLLLSAAGLVFGRILYIIPIFFLGMLQMQSASLRTTSAMIIGIITPYWIALGMGWVDTSRFDFTTLAIQWKIPDINPQLLSTAAIMLLGLCIGIGNMVNVMNENIRTRAFNGFINIMSVSAAVLMIIDIAHYQEYLPLLNACVALQCSYHFAAHNSRMHNIIFYTLIATLISYLAWIYWM